MKKSTVWMRLTWTLFFAMMPLVSQAARPLVTDDARLTNAHSCQLETWTRQYEGGQELWALPACNFGENFEVTLGGGRYDDRAENYHTEDWVAQFKTLFKPLESNGWGWGLAVGRVMHPDIQSGPNQLGNTYVYLPVSWSMLQDALVVHLNVGMLRDRQQSQNKATLGLGSEFQLSQRLRGIAEIFGDHTQAPFYQFGVRYSIIPNLFQVDGTIGQQVNGQSDDQWLSVGLRWTP